MSFSICTSFSTSYQALGSVQLPSYQVQLASSVASIYAGIRGSGSQISVFCSPSVQGS